MKSIIIAICFLMVLCSLCFSNPYPTIYYLGLENTKNFPYVRQYEIRHTAACLQGIVNRQAPRIMISVDWTGFHWPTPDSPWVSVLRSSGGLCENWGQNNISNIYALLTTFRNYIKGVVVYDPSVYSTSLVATTVAGVEDAIAVRYDTSPDSMYYYLVISSSGPKLPIIVDLVGKFTGSGNIWETSTPSTGSAKCDAYIWAKEKYIDTGKCDPTVLVYSLDQFALTIPNTTSSTWPTACFPNHYQLQSLDYAVSKKGFVFELSPWGDEIPNDDPTQPLGTDLNTYKTILAACNSQTNQTQMIKCAGYINWPFKYTTYGSKGIHSEVSTEWEMMKIQTAYNIYSETDWSVANTSFYSGLMPEVCERNYVQNPPPTYANLVSRGIINGTNGTVNPGNYILMCNTDYDSAGWTMYLLAMDRFNDSAKATIPANWGINPNLIERSSAAYDFMYRNKGVNDYFMTSASGAGYINPTKLRSRYPSNYPSGVAIWQKHCKYYYGLLDYSVTGWMFNGSSGNMSTTDTANYAVFSGRGIGIEGNYTGISPGIVSGVPILERGLFDNPSASNLIAYSSGVNFAWYRYVLHYPYQIRDIQNQYPTVHPGIPHHFLDIPSFYYLINCNRSQGFKPE